MRVIGLDVHRTFTAGAVLNNTQLSHPGRGDLTREAVLAFGRKLRPDDEVVIEATVNTAMIARLLRAFVSNVVIANPLQVRAIAHAKIKTDKIAATILAKLLSWRCPFVYSLTQATGAICERPDCLRVTGVRTTRGDVGRSSKDNARAR